MSELGTPFPVHSWRASESCHIKYQPINMSCTVMGIDSRCESSILRKFGTFFKVQSMRTTLLFLCVLGVLLCFVGSFGCFLFVLAQVFLASGGPLCAWLLFTAGPSPRLVRHFLNYCRFLRSLWLVPLALRWFLFDWFFFRKESRRLYFGWISSDRFPSRLAPLHG